MNEFRSAGPSESFVTLRRATDADSDAMIRLIGDVFAEYPGCVLDVDREEPELRAPGTLFDRAWVAEDARGAVLGCIAFAERDAGRAELKKLYVSQDARGLGLGRRLVALVEEEARGRGLSVVELWSDTRFLTAHAVYDRLGYVGTGRERDLHDLSHTTEWHFEKRL